MKAVIIPRHGGAEVLSYVQDFPDPQPAPEEVVVRVAATTVNQMDLLVRNGYPNRTLPLPHVPGGDVTGTVDSLGSEVTGLSVGQRVVVYPLLSCGKCSLCRSGRPNLCADWQTVGIHHHGGYAERVAVPAANVIPIPDHLDFERAASIPVAGLSSHHALATVARLSEGETVVIWGAAGGLGSMAVQVAHHLGAQVVAIVGASHGRAMLEELGVHAVIDRSSKAVAERLREIVPDGADAVFDTIGGATFASSLAMLKNGGRLVSCGIMGGRETPLNIHQVYYHHLTIHGVFLGTMDDMRSMVDLVGRGVVTPQIDRILPLKEAAAGQRMLESGQQTGKIILNIEE